MVNILFLFIIHICFIHLFVEKFQALIQLKDPNGASQAKIVSSSSRFNSIKIKIEKK